MNHKKKIVSSIGFFQLKGLLKATFSFFFLIVLSVNSFAVCANDSPVLDCATVLSNGDVTINWLPPTNTAQFNSYHIYSSNSAVGPFTVVDSVFTSSQTSYTHVGASADIAPVYYYIQSRCTDFEFSSVLDTLNTILLNVVNPANGTAQLSWNPIVSSSPISYSIYKEYPAGLWSLIATKSIVAGLGTSIVLIDTILVCNASLNYKVEVGGSSGCISSSTISGDIFQNTIKPGTPSFDTISVADNNTTLLSWGVSQSADVVGYVIYKFDGTAWTVVDSILGKNSTAYNDLSSNAASVSEKYRLAAYDNCGLISPQGNPTNTMFLSSTPDVCSKAAILSWTAASPFNNGIGGYRVFQSTIGLSGPYTLVASLANDAQSYSVTGLTAKTTYYFKVEAVDRLALKTVSSNRISFYSDSPVPPQFLYLQNVSVIDPNQVILTCHIDISSAESNFKIMRSTVADSGVFVQVGAVSSQGASPITYTDTDVLTDNKSYYYKVISVDSCGLDGLVSNTAKSILLTIVTDRVLITNSLTWNDYEFWDGNVVSYDIYRAVDGVWEGSPIASFPYVGIGVNGYVDDVSELTEGQGVFSYYIEATEGGGATFSFTERSISNTAEAYQDSKVFIPNAFFPDGIHNTRFKPVTKYVKLEGYDFRVFNRMGLVVFETTELNEGWDGTYKGKVSAFGVYVYMVRFKSTKGEYIDRKGSVTLMR